MALFKHPDPIEALDDLLDRERVAVLRGDLNTLVRMAPEKERLLSRLAGASGHTRAIRPAAREGGPQPALADRCRQWHRPGPAAVETGARGARTRPVHLFRGRRTQRDGAAPVHAGKARLSGATTVGHSVRPRFGGAVSTPTPISALFQIRAIQPSRLQVSFRHCAQGGPRIQPDGACRSEPAAVVRMTLFESARPGGQRYGAQSAKLEGL